MTINRQIVDYAESFAGQEEIGNNGGWKDKAFENAMKAIGWAFGWAWCASFVRMVYLHIAEVNYGKDSVQYKELNSVLSHSVLKTFQNAKKHPNFAIKHYPDAGSIIILNHGAGKGHTGISCFPTTDLSLCCLIEGNTNKAGSREGKWVMRKNRSLLSASYLGCINYKGFNG